MSRVDVFVPCYKYGRYLRDCVDSVLTQRGVDVRVLILDDCSPDDTHEVGSRLAAEDPRVEYRRHSVNHGHIATYNEGLDWAGGDYMLLLSADDALTPGAFERAARVMDDNPQVGLVYGKRILWHGESPTTSHPFVDRPWGAKVLDGGQFLEMMCREDYNPVCTPTAVVRTAIQKKVGYYRKELPHTGDCEMWMRFAVYGSVGILDAEQAFWRQHDANMREHYRGLDDVRHHKAAFDSVFGEHRAAIGDAERLWGIANRRLAEVAFWRGHACFEQGRQALCDEYLRVARECDPEICSARHWSRLRVKRAMGPKLWTLLSRVRNWRPTPGAVATTPATAGDRQQSRWMA